MSMPCNPLGLESVAFCVISKSDVCMPGQKCYQDSDLPIGGMRERNKGMGQEARPKWRGGKEWTERDGARKAMKPKINQLRESERRGDLKGRHSKRAEDKEGILRWLRY